MTPAAPPLRLIIVGAGTIGREHARVAAEFTGDLDLVAVVDPEDARAIALADPVGAGAFADLRSALAATRADLVAVCTPSGTHGDLATLALRAGRHVIVEKPAEITPQRIDALIAARDDAGRVVAVISQHRFDPATAAVADAVARGRLGRLTSGFASVDWYRTQAYYDSGGWRGTWALDGGGALMNQGIHTVDLLVAMFGPPAEVSGFTATLAHRGLDVEDVATATVRFASGALAVLHATTAAYPGLTARLAVYGDRGSAVIEADGLTHLWAAAESGLADPEPSAAVDLATATRRTTEPATTAGSDPGALSPAHAWQYRNILAAIRGEARLLVTLEQHRQAVALICATYESARTGRAVRL